MAVDRTVAYYRSDTKHGRRTQTDRAVGPTCVAYKRICHTAAGKASIFMTVQDEFVIPL